MAIHRRDVVKAAALGPVAVSGAATAAWASSAIDAGKIVHHVLFWLKRPGSAADRDQLVAGLRRLAAIPVVRSLQIGTPASTGRRGVVDGTFDVSELMVFDSVADERAYQGHPLHLEFVAECEHLWTRVVVYDVATV